MLLFCVWNTIKAHKQNMMSLETWICITLKSECLRQASYLLLLNIIQLSLSKLRAE